MVLNHDFVCRYTVKRYKASSPFSYFQVDCYISRPNEKSFMLHFMFSSAAISAFLTLCEIIFFASDTTSNGWIEKETEIASRSVILGILNLVDLEQ